MKCESCKHEFCWLCLGEYYGYRHSMADNGAVCGLRPLIGGIFITICGLSVYLKFLFCLNASIFLWPIFVHLFWFIWLTVKYTCVAAVAYGLERGFMKILNEHQNTTRLKKHISLFCGVCLLLNQF